MRWVWLGAFLTAARALAGDSDQLEVPGFSEDATSFAYWVYGVHDGSGHSYAELKVLDLKTGQPNKTASMQLELEESGERTALNKLKKTQAPVLAQLKIGKDLGTELYKSGSATKTHFKTGEVEYSLSVERTSRKETESGSVDQIDVWLESRGKGRKIFHGGGGFDYSLNAVKMSADGKRLVVFLRYSTSGFEGPNRRYLTVPMVLE